MVGFGDDYITINELLSISMGCLSVAIDLDRDGLPFPF